MIVRIEANPVSIVRALIGPTSLHDICKDGALTCVGGSPYPIVAPLVARIKFKSFRYSACWNLLQLFSFKLLKDVEVSSDSLEILAHQDLRMLLNDRSCESSRLKQLLSNDGSLLLPSLLLNKKVSLRHTTDVLAFFSAILDYCFIATAPLVIPVIDSAIIIFQIEFVDIFDIVLPSALEPTMQMAGTICMFLLSNNVLINR